MFWLYSICSPHWSTIKISWSCKTFFTIETKSQNITVTGVKPMAQLIKDYNFGFPLRNVQQLDDIEQNILTDDKYQTSLVSAIFTWISNWFDFLQRYLDNFSQIDHYHGCISTNINEYCWFWQFFSHSKRFFWEIKELELKNCQKQFSKWIHKMRINFTLKCSKLCRSTV